MKVNVNVYTKDLNAALSAYKLAVESGAIDINLCSHENWDTEKFEHFSFSFVADNRSDAISKLDDGPWFRDSDDL